MCISTRGVCKQDRNEQDPGVLVIWSHLIGSSVTHGLYHETH